MGVPVGGGNCSIFDTSYATGRGGRKRMGKAVRERVEGKNKGREVGGGGEVKPSLAKILATTATALIQVVSEERKSGHSCWYCRYDCTDMNIYRSALCACVVRGLPNIYEYINKDRNKAEEKKKRT